MFEKLENWMRSTTKSIRSLREELSDLRSEVRHIEPMYGSRWYYSDLLPEEDYDFLD